jgi:nitrate reductase NapAB chaperone NapD
MRADRRDPVVKELRAFKPARFEVVLRDGQRKALLLSTKANKWELLSDTLSKLPWTSIEALGVEGNVLGVVERDDDGHEDEEMDTVSELHAFAVILKDMVSHTLDQARRMYGDVLSAQSQLIANSVEATGAMRDAYQLALKAQATASVVGAVEGAGAGADDPVMKMIMGAMALKFGPAAAAAFMGQVPPQGASQ